MDEFQPITSDVLADLGRQDLIKIIGQQAEQLHGLREEIQTLKKANEHLRAQNEQRQRESNRSAAPHRRESDERKETPDDPGRKPGHKGHCRPRPDRIDHRVEVPLEACPHCGETELADPRPITQYIEEIPRPQVQTTKLTTWRGRCPHCGDVETTHRLKTTSAGGAAGRGLGPRAQATAVSLAYDQGLTLGKSCRLLKDLFNLDLSRGGLSQLAQRTSDDLAGDEAELAARARQADIQHVDETSWWVAGAAPEVQPHWLWVFTNENQTLYRIDHRRNRDVVNETLGGDFAGVLVSDCLNIYDGLYATQQKCYAHHLKAISRAQGTYEASHSAPSSYLQRIRAMLTAARVLKKRSDGRTKRRGQAYRTGLEKTADKLLRPNRPRSDLTEPEESIRNRLWKQRDHLFVFLDYPQVKATNNQAERQLRPAVIKRKLSAGNRTSKGARTWEILASLAATDGQQGRSFTARLMKNASYSPESLNLR